MRWRLLAIGLSAVFVCRATAQSRRSATQPAAPQDRSLIWLDELRFHLDFEAELSRRRVHEQRRFLPLRTRQTEDLRRFEETIGAEGRGWIGSQRLAEYTFDIRGGLSQERFTQQTLGPDVSNRPHGDLFEYDASLTLFPAGRITARAFATRLDDRIPRPFLPSLDRTHERYGASISFNSRTLPMQLSFEHLFDDLRSSTRDLLDTEQRGQDLLRYEATWQPSEYHSLELNYEYEDRDERFSGTRTVFDTRRNDLTLEHTLSFGRDHRSRIETLFRWQDEAGDLAHDVLEFAPQLRLQHTDDLFTTWRYQFLREQFDRVQTETHRGDLGLTHTLGEHLTASYNLYALRQDAEIGADLREYGGSGNWSYSQKNRFGHFNASLTYTHARQRSSDAGRFGVVVNEAVTFRDPLPAYLAHQNVNPFTVLVTDITRTRVFLAGRDYVVVSVGGFAALQRLRSGNILNGQTVYVSYIYRTVGDYELARDRIDYRIEQRFDFGLTPYYAGSIQNEDIDRDRRGFRFGFARFRERNLNRHRIGATFRRRRWSAAAEYEFHDDSIDPYEGFHLNGDIVLIETPQHNVSARAGFSRLFFTGSRFLGRHDSTLLDLGLSWRYVLGPRIEATTQAAYRFEDDTRFGRTHGVDITTSIRCRIGLFTASFDIEYDLLDLPDSRDGTVAAWIRLRREIPVRQ